MDKDKFQRLRDELYNEILIVNTPKELTEEFNIKFFKLIELCSFSLMNGTDSFFAYFLIQMKREIKHDMVEATGTKFHGNSFAIYFNPAIFLECSFLEMQALIKHEIYHIMSGHHLRARALRERYSSLAVNLAMDISINQYIVNLPPWANTIERVKLSYNVDLEEEQTMEQYAAKIQAAINKLARDKKQGVEAQQNFLDEEYIQREHDSSQAHELWYIDEEINAEMMKESTKKLAANSAKGKIPDSIDELLRQMNKKAELMWKDYLRRLLGTLPAGYKKTSTRRDRRQPDRLDIRGRLSRHIAQIVVAIDISGSVSDKELEQIMGEIFALIKNYPSQFTIIECDSDIRRVYQVRNIKEIKKKVNTRGATKFSPVFDYMIKSKMKNHVLIYFTDGLGEEELSVTPVNKYTLWVLTGKGEELSLKKPFGVVKRLSYVKKEEPEYTNALEILKEARTIEWSQFS
jgi:predicted metal-dependent peptidase